MGYRHPTHMQGFSLLEVLIAIVVLSFGMLGLAGLQTNGVRNTHSANLRTLAVHQAYDMADRMRANPNGVKQGLYDNIPITAGGASSCVSTTCSATQLRDYDQYVWNTNNTNMLPLGRGTVTAIATTAAPNREFLITVMWDEYRTGATGTGCGSNPSVDLTCVRITFRL